MKGAPAKDESRSAVRFTGVLLSLLMTGCASVPPRENGSPEGGPVVAEASAVRPAPDRSVAPKVAATPPPALDALVAGPPKAPPRKGSAPPKATGASATASPAAIPPPPAPPAPDASPAKRSAAPPLDLKALVARLRETEAIGMFTKLALKNQVDDLLDRFREHYATQVKTPVAELRPPYDRLLLKVLAAVQDDDPSLARAIVDSREPIWDILADPARFATI
jgi:hypothetical protein